MPSDPVGGGGVRGPSSGADTNRLQWRLSTGSSAVVGMGRDGDGNLLTHSPIPLSRVQMPGI